MRRSRRRLLGVVLVLLLLLIFGLVVWAIFAVWVRQFAPLMKG